MVEWFLLKDNDAFFYAKTDGNIKSTETNYGKIFLGISRPRIGLLRRLPGGSVSTPIMRRRNDFFFLFFNKTGDV